MKKLRSYRPLNRLITLRFLAYAGGFLFLSFLVVSIGIWLLSRTPWFQNRVQTALQNSASSSLNGEISWKTIRITSLSSVSISGLILTTKKGEAVISIDRAEGRVALLPLFKRRIVLTHLHLKNPVVDYNQRIHPNIADVFTAPSKPPKSHGPAWTFSIRKFTIDSLRAHYQDVAGHSTNLKCGRLAGRLSVASEFAVKSMGQSLRLDIPGHSLFMDTLYFSLRNDAAAFFCDGLFLKSAGHMTAQGSFAIPHTNLDAIRADISAHADNAFLAGINARTWGLDHCGSVACSAHLRGVAARPVANVNIEVHTILLRKIALDHAKINLKRDSLGLTVCRLSLDDQALSGTINLSTRLYNPLSKPFFDGYRVDGEILIPDLRNLNRVAVKIKAPDLLRKGAARLSVTASGSSFKQMPYLAHCTVGLTDITFPNGKIMPAATLQADIINDTFVVKGEWPEVFNVNARGSLVQDKGSGSGTLDITDARPLTVLLINKEMYGAIKGNFSINKFLSAPSAKVDLLGTGITWEGLVVNNLKTDFAYDNKRGITINAASADLRGPLENALKNSGKPGIRGYLTATLTARGPVAYPNAKVHLTIDSLVSAFPVADMITATITLHDSIIMLNTFKLTKGLAVINGSGSFDRSRKDITANLSIRSGRGSALGTLSMKAMVADSAMRNGICTATNVPVDAAHAWFPAITFPSAKLSMHASMNGKFSNPSLAGTFQVSEIALIKTDVKPNFKGEAKLENHQVFALCTLSVEDSCGPLTLSAHAAVLPSLRLDTLGPLPLEIKVYGSNVCLKPYVRAFSKNIVLDGSLNADGKVSFRHGTWTPEGVVSIASKKIVYPPLNLNVENVSFQMKPQDDPAHTGIQPIGISLQTGNVHYGDIFLPKASVQAAFKSNALVIDAAKIFFEKGKLSIAGSVPLVPFPAMRTRRDIHLTLSADSVGVITINPFINGGHFTSGTINGSVNFSPGRSKIINEGTLSADNIVFAVDDITPAIGPLQFNIRIAGDSVLVSGGGPWGTGKTAERGFLTFSNNSPGPSRVTLNSEGLTISYLDDTKVRIDSLRAALSNPLGKWGLDGYVLLGESKVTYEVPFSQQTIARANTPLSQKKSLSLNIQLNIPNSLTTDLKLGSILSGSASDIRTSIGGTLLITGTISNPQYAGQVQIDSGEATYLSRVFTIKRGYARLTGRNEINPFIDIVATTNISQVQTTYGADSIVVTLHISGDLKKPVISLTSNKGFSQLEIISLLTFGSTTISLAGAGSGGPTSIISSSLSTVVSKQAKNTLGLEQVKFQGNLFTTGSSQANASVSVSKKISPTITVTYSRGIADTIAQQGVISWKLKPFLFLEFESNDRGNAGIDLKYRIKK